MLVDKNLDLSRRSYESAKVGGAVSALLHFSKRGCSELSLENDSTRLIRGDSQKENLARGKLAFSWNRAMRR